MDDNFFRPGTTDSERFTNFHDEAFEMLDTDGRHERRGWPKEGDDHNTPYNNQSNNIGDMKDEMKSTMDLMNDRTDKSSCGCSSKSGKSNNMTANNLSNNLGDDNFQSNNKYEGVNDMYDQGVELDIIEIDIIDAGSDFGDDYTDNNFREGNGINNDRRNNTFTNETGSQPKSSCGCSSKNKTENLNDSSSNYNNDNFKKENQYQSGTGNSGKKSCSAKRDNWNNDVTNNDREMMNNNYNSSSYGSNQQDLEQGSEFVGETSNKSKSCRSK